MCANICMYSLYTLFGLSTCDHIVNVNISCCAFLKEIQRLHSAKQTSRELKTLNIIAHIQIVYCFNQNNFGTYFWFSYSPICKKAFNVFNNATLFKQNRKIIPVISCSNTGPQFKQSYKLFLSCLVLANSLYTTFTLVVV